MKTDNILLVCSNNANLQFSLLTVNLVAVFWFRGSLKGNLSWRKEGRARSVGSVIYLHTDLLPSLLKQWQGKEQDEKEQGEKEEEQGNKEEEEGEEGKEQEGQKQEEENGRVMRKS